MSTPMSSFPRWFLIAVAYPLACRSMPLLVVLDQHSQGSAPTIGTLLTKNRLMQGGLVALVWKSGTNIDVNLGIIASSLRDLTDSAKRHNERLDLRVVFFDSNIELRILEILKRPGEGNRTVLLLESPVMFEAIRPFLE